jgi:hypothetical protein
MRVEKTNPGDQFRILPYAMLDTGVKKVALDLFFSGKCLTYSEAAHTLHSGKRIKFQAVTVDDEKVVVTSDKGEMLTFVPLTLALFNKHVKAQASPTSPLNSDDDVQDFYQEFFAQFKF